MGFYGWLRYFIPFIRIQSIIILGPNIHSFDIAEFKVRRGSRNIRQTPRSKRRLPHSSC